MGEDGGGLVRHFFGVEDISLLVYLFSGLSLLVLAYSLIAFYVRVFGGSRPPSPPGGLGGALRRLVVYAGLQKKVIAHRFPGAVHAMIFYGILWLFVATVLRALDYYLGGFILQPPFYYAYKLLNNLAGFAVIAGSLVALYRRARGLTPRLPRDPSYYLVILLLTAIAVTGFMLNGLVAALYRAGTGLYTPLYDPGGYVLYLAFRNLPGETLLDVYRALWLLHMSTAQLAIALIPYTNLWHIPAALANIAFASETPARRLRSYPDVEERLEKDVPVGIVKITDTTWRQRLDYEACTSCMRCTNACPAAASGKVLDPRGVIFGMRLLLRSGGDGAVWSPDNPGDGSVAGVNPEAIWSCLTCGACVAECPVLIHHVDTIIDVRRGMLFTGDDSVPEGALRALENLQYNGNPLGANPVEKEEWLRELDERLGGVVAKEGEEYDYLVWFGCVTSYDPRLRPVAEAILRLLRKAGVKAAVLPYTGCTGDPALRMGEEALFLESMKAFLRELSRYKFKKLLVNCPHCYNVLKNDYPRYRDALRGDDEELVGVLDRLKVEHHSQVLARLVSEGKLKPGSLREAAITYHDPCYLGRWNGVYEEPRKVVRATGLRIREMPRNREKSFCCGGGGGHLFFEIKRGRRVSRIRAEEAAKTLGNSGGRKVVAVACPFCNTMFRAEAEDLGFEVRDVAEILDEAMRGS